MDAVVHELTRRWMTVVEYPGGGHVRAARYHAAMFLLKPRRMARGKLPSAWHQLRTDERRHRASVRRIRATVQANGTLPPPDSAKMAGLRYVNEERTPGIRRIGRHNRFRYVDANGRAIGSAAELSRIKSLAIPPAWTDVWICPDPRGHLQATGRDARARK